MSTDTITPPRTMLEVYESLPEGTPVQLIKNKLIMSPSPLSRHQRMLGKLFLFVKAYVDKENLGEVFMAPYDVHLDEENVFQPDILFVARENLHKIKENGFYGAPDLVIEILSPGTAQYDQEEKKEEYERFGVKEYWIVAPDSATADGFLLEHGRFEKRADQVAKLKLRLLDLVINI